MGIRFRRSIRIAPGVKVNLTKTGVGFTVGPRGAHYSVHSSGRRTKTIGLPGTGVYYQESSTGASNDRSGSPATAPVAAKSSGCTPAGCGALVVGLLVIGAIANLVGGGSPSATPGVGGTSPPGAALLGAGPTDVPDATPSAEPSATAATPPTATPKPVATPKPTAAPKPTAKPAALSVSLVAAPGTVSPGSYATVSVRTSGGATCSIVVDYASGPSKASGLVTKVAPSSGLLSWTWKVGTRTSAGTWPVYITCQRGSSSASVETAVHVT